MKTRKLWTIAIVFILVSCAPKSTTIPSTETAIPASTVSPVLPAPTATSEPTNIHLTPTQNLIKPGTYLVGVDINSGIYRGEAEGELPSAICYWARLKDISGNVDAVLASNNVHGQFYIEIRDSDYAFKTTCELVPLDSIPANTGTFPTTIKYGMYLVGRDIQAGTYKGQALNGAKTPCIWERRSNVAGAWDGVIANYHEPGQFYVQIAESDFSFSTTCELERVGD
jgi:hypothetical protein